VVLLHGPTRVLSHGAHLQCAVDPSLFSRLIATQSVRSPEFKAWGRASRIATALSHMTENRQVEAQVMHFPTHDCEILP
jgi:hypothetical protein